MSYQVTITSVQAPDINTQIAKGCVVTFGVIGAALFVIGCLAATGHLSGVVAGGCAVGLAIPLLIAALINSSRGKLSAICKVIMNVALVIIGALACAGVISGAAVGYAIVTPVFLAFLANCCPELCARVKDCGIDLGEDCVNLGITYIS